ncbi:MAG: hypothetical protein PF692_08740 [Kiritimatiellae bacterium]|nr:hypothetical protein [Kiritimatiellia bacterium]
MGGNINIKEEKNFSDRKFIGFDLSLGYVPEDGKKKSLNIGKYDCYTFLYPGAFTVVDFYDEIKADTVVTTSVFQ